MEQTLEMLAEATEGYAGADLRALCSGAVSAAVRRSAPSLFDNLDEAALPDLAPPSHGPTTLRKNGYPPEAHTGTAHPRDGAPILPTNGYAPAEHAGRARVGPLEAIPLAESRRGSGTVPSSSEGCAGDSRQGSGALSISMVSSEGALRDTQGLHQTRPYLPHPGVGPSTPGRPASLDLPPRKRRLRDELDLDPEGRSGPVAPGKSEEGQGDLQDACEGVDGRSGAHVPVCDRCVGVPDASGDGDTVRRIDARPAFEHMVESTLPHAGHVSDAAPAENPRPPEGEREVGMARVSGLTEPTAADVDRWVGEQMDVGVEGPSARCPGGRRPADGIEAAGPNVPGMLNVLSRVKVRLPKSTPEGSSAATRGGVGMCILSRGSNAIGPIASCMALLFYQLLHDRFCRKFAVQMLMACGV